MLFPAAGAILPFFLDTYPDILGRFCRLQDDLYISLEYALCPLDYCFLPRALTYGIIVDAYWFFREQYFPKFFN